MRHYNKIASFITSGLMYETWITKIQKNTNELSIRLMHEFSRERQLLHCDVIVGKQIFLN